MFSSTVFELWHCGTQLEKHENIDVFSEGQKIFVDFVNGYFDDCVIHDGLKPKYMADVLKQVRSKTRLAKELAFNRFEYPDLHRVLLNAGRVRLKRVGCFTHFRSPVSPSGRPALGQKNPRR